MIFNLDIDYPIIQAPMAGVSTPRLAAGVSNAGGLGSISIGAASLTNAQNMIDTVRNLTNKPYNVNVFAHQPATPKPDVERRWLERMAPQFQRLNTAAPLFLREIYKSILVDEDMQSLLVKSAPPVVSFHFGLPGPSLTQKLKNAGCTLIATVTNKVEAYRAAEAGMDAIVAQGYEAGGHRGVYNLHEQDEQLDTANLVEILVHNQGLPVIAAGGIMDGYAIRSYLKRGASAVQLGTAFIACPESSADAAYRDALAHAREGGTRMTSVISGRPARCLCNKFTLWEEENAIEPSFIPDYPLAYDVGKALNAAAKSQGETGYGAQWAGQGAHKSRALSVADLMRQLISEMQMA